MITDSKNIKWTKNKVKSEWTSSEGFKFIIHQDANEEQVLKFIESMYTIKAVQNTDAERIAELEAKIDQLLSKS